MAATMVTAAVVIFIFVNIVHLLALLKKDNGIMDAAWGTGFILVTLFTLGMADHLDARQVLLGALVLVWGARLTLHILVRNAGRAGEDFRYRNWRETWGRWFYVRSYFQIYMLQGAVMFVVSAPSATPQLVSKGS